MEILQLNPSISATPSERSEIFYNDVNPENPNDYLVDLPLASNGKILNKYEDMRITDFEVGPTLGK